MTVVVYVVAAVELSTFCSVALGPMEGTAASGTTREDLYSSL